ncbi:MAG: N-acetylmuramic acid 6-phosphate etherase [Sporolactobacillus sp.]|nr:N-acetylmuramic acid 6-phosphate etherase [Sporolactobacillus sp.]MCI1880577.1 N-acetylmuramic acid 6-phosphate etherase [Sporolactobacillus sp.]
MDLEKLTTEQRNAKTMNLDQLSIAEILKLMNNEDQFVPKRIQKVLPQVEQAVEATIHAFNHQGRLIYMGAGTSGRLGVLDAAECVPTFSADPSMVIGLIAGGPGAMTTAVEGAEDSGELGEQDLRKLHLTNHDVVVGIAASGRTPYVVGGLTYAQKVGATTVSLSCNENAVISRYAKIPIEVNVGQEILTGSTRLKSGTAQKLILNMISTASMIGVGKVYKNLMVDVKPSNAKLIERAKRIIMEATNCSYETAEEAFQKANRNVKLAIVMLLTHLNLADADRCLRKVDGHVRKAIHLNIDKEK